MNENLIEAQYDISKKSKLRRFYDSNKVLIFSFILFLVILLLLVAIPFKTSILPL